MHCDHWDLTLARFDSIRFERVGGRRVESVWHSAPTLISRVCVLCVAHTTAMSSSSRPSAHSSPSSLSAPPPLALPHGLNLYITRHGERVDQVFGIDWSVEECGRENGSAV